MKHRQSPRTRPLVETRHIAIPVVLNRALSEMTERAGHGNASRIVQELIAREAARQFGRNWARRFAENDKQEASAA